MDKIKVNGGGASPVYDFLKVAAGDTSPILWNFGGWVWVGVVRVWVDVF
jgi:glutathione peroxidase-family protein